MVFSSALRKVAFAFVALGAVTGCRSEPYALVDVAVLSRPDSEDAFFVARVVARDERAMPATHVSVKNARGDVHEVGVCEGVASRVSPSGAWCMFLAHEQRPFTQFSTRFELTATDKAPKPLLARDALYLPPTAGELPKAGGSVVNETRDRVVWKGTAAIARGADGKVVGGGIQRGPTVLEPGRAEPVVVPLAFLSDRPATIELYPAGEAP